VADFPPQHAAYPGGAVMSEPVISLQHVGKSYRLYDHDFDRIREIFTGKARYKQLVALEDISFDVQPGEVVGVVGKNGAGKSTLLKILANTMQPSSGSVAIKGRVAALLELGASFHPEMSGHDNIYLNCSIQGLSKAETDAIYADIINFSGISEFIHQPVKTYSTGMFVRLAFSIATHIDPDILIIDEALSVGDGVFARRSFDRIMEFKRSGKTILFCSHSLYQVEAICDRVLWLERGRIRSSGDPARVVTEYGEFLRMESSLQENLEVVQQVESPQTAKIIPKSEIPRILDVAVSVDGHVAKALRVRSGRSLLAIRIKFHPGENLPLPSLGIAFTGGDGRILSSVGSVNDGLVLQIDSQGIGSATVEFPEFPLLKGNYNIDIYLMCEQGLHVYEAITQAAELNVEQQGLARGIVNMPHAWKS
jgi:lipopolysaccharide transport system ATP-binding protein